MFCGAKYTRHPCTPIIKQNIKLQLQTLVWKKSMINKYLKNPYHIKIAPVQSLPQKVTVLLQKAIIKIILLLLKAIIKIIHNKKQQININITPSSLEA